MKMLLIHSDFVEWEAKTKALRSAEEIKVKNHRVDEALVAFCSVEKQDESGLAEISRKAVDEILKVNAQVKAKSIVVYPFVHLSQNPSSPAAALEAVQVVEKSLKEKGLDVHRAPFGWYKGFNIKCKGHPLSELSRDINVSGAQAARTVAVGAPETAKKEEVSEAIKKEEALKSEWFIVEPDGEMHTISMEEGKIKGYDFTGKDKLRKLVSYEMAKNREAKGEPPHVPIMKRLELVDYEPASDPGHFRYYPKGRMVKSLMERFVTERMLEYGALEVETPIMYDKEHPTLKSYLNRFPARQYNIETPNKKVFLRFAACFGGFLMSHDALLTYKTLPFRPYELTRYSFRVEQRGELSGLRRLRAFTMPDCHAICADIEQAKDEMLKRFRVSKKIQEGFGFSLKDDFEVSMRVVKEFWDANKDFIIGLIKEWGRPVLVEMWDKKFFYFVFKHEWNFIDASDKAACLTTDQIDVENAQRYGITYVDRDNTEKTPVILHLSPSGSLERVIYAMLEKAGSEQKIGKNAMLPLWLCPTQLRILPLSEKFTEDAKKLVQELAKEGIRSDLDDRNETVQSKVRDAELEWVPHSVVMGGRELETGDLPVRHRSTAKVEKMKKAALVKLIKDQIEGFPTAPLPLPMEVSKRPKFVGAI